MERRGALTVAAVALGLMTAFILLEVFATVVFAITVAYVLLPIKRWLVRRGVPDWWAATATTLVGFLSAAAIFAPIAAALWWRRGDIVSLLRSLPDELSVEVAGQVFAITTVELQNIAIDSLRGTAFAVAAAAPELALKIALFVIVLFALLLKWEAAAKAAIAPVPQEHRPVALALSERARETLWAIYVLQLGTSVATLIIGWPLFWLLGYEAPFALALIAAILQFVPIIGPSLLIVPIALWHLFVGELLAAVLVLVLGVGLVAWFPDIWVRPRLARETAGMPGSLYFIGFIGGLFTLGPIGIVVGPLVVSVFVEAVTLLGAENHAENLEDILAEIEPAESGDAEETTGPTGDDAPRGQAADGTPTGPTGNGPGETGAGTHDDPTDRDGTDAVEFRGDE